MSTPLARLVFRFVLTLFFIFASTWALRHDDIPMAILMLLWAMFVNQPVNVE